MNLSDSFFFGFKFFRKKLYIGDKSLKENYPTWYFFFFRFQLACHHVKTFYPINQKLDI